jgi:hypothetical protein
VNQTSPKVKSGLPINSSVKGRAARRSKRAGDIKSGSELADSEPFLLLVFSLGAAFQPRASLLARDIFLPASSIILSMTIKNQLNESMKDAMRSGDEVRKQLSGK